MFLAASNELSTPKILFCPSEYETTFRQAATSFGNTVTGSVASQVPYTNDLNISYFIGVDASETQPQMFLTGDHNLGGNANPPTIAYLAAVEHRDAEGFPGHELQRQSRSRPGWTICTPSRATSGWRMAVRRVSAVPGYRKR